MQTEATMMAVSATTLARSRIGSHPVYAQALFIDLNSDARAGNQLRSVNGHCCPYSTLVASLNLKRWILPNVVFGNSSTKSMLCGYWYR